jgi:hypothetical protein
VSTPNFIEYDLVNRIESARSRLDARYQRGIRQYPITDVRTEAKQEELSAVLDAVVLIDKALLKLQAADQAMARGNVKFCECDEPENETCDGGRTVRCVICGGE